MALISMAHVSTNKEGTKARTSMMESDDEDLDDLNPTDAKILEELDKDMFMPPCCSSTSTVPSATRSTPTTTSSTPTSRKPSIPLTTSSSRLALTLPRRVTMNTIVMPPLSSTSLSSGGDKGNAKEFNMLPKHARIQRITYAP
ncbi:hypothetical protein CR513_36192, partial [Mucuna pruriens]